MNRALVSWRSKINVPLRAMMVGTYYYMPPEQAMAVRHPAIGTAGDLTATYADTLFLKAAVLTGQFIVRKGGSAYDKLKRRL